MTGRGRIGVLAALALAFAAGWWFGRDPAPTRDAPGVSLDELRALRAERDELGVELARLRRARRAPPPEAHRRAQPGGEQEPFGDGAEPSVPPTPPPPTESGPHPARLTIDGFSTAATYADWPMLGAVVRHRRRAMELHRRLAAAADDDERDALDGERERVLDWTQEVIDEAAARLPEQLGDTPATALTHPVATASVLAATLDAEGRPLTIDQATRLSEVARRWGERETLAAAADAADSNVAFLVALMRRVERREAFLAEALSIASAEQLAVLRPTEGARFVGSDFFSAAPVLAERAGSYWSLPDMPLSLGELVATVDGPGLTGEPEAVRERVFDIAREWERSVPADALPYHPSGDVNVYRVSFLRAVAASMARLHDRWLLEAGLGPGARSNLRGEREIFMLQATPPAR